LSCTGANSESVQWCRKFPFLFLLKTCIVLWIYMYVLPATYSRAAPRRFSKGRKEAADAHLLGTHAQTRAVSRSAVHVQSPHSTSSGTTVRPPARYWERLRDCGTSGEGAESHLSAAASWPSCCQFTQYCSQTKAIRSRWFGDRRVMVPRPFFRSSSQPRKLCQAYQGDYPC
jgi:hypothetical protein